MLPVLLLAGLGQMSFTGVVVTTGAVFLAWLTRLIAMPRFRQPLGSPLLHPLGVLALLAFQWLALARQCAGKLSVWKGRSCCAAPKTA